MNDQRATLVTGAASGFGLAIAKYFAALGHKQLLVDISESITDVASSLSTEAAPVYPHIADIGVEADVVGSAKRATELFGGADILINCAGVSVKRNGLPIPPVDYTTEEWNSTLRINLTAPFLLSRDLIPAMREKRFGRIVNIASRAGRTYVPAAGVDYSASKAGLIGFSRLLAGTYGPDGITVNVVAPGRCVTPLAMRSSPETIEKAIAGIPVGRLGTPEEIAAAVGFLAAESSGYINGTTLDANGGAFMS
jgi:3-oxoacyl-[acyl-carrier protein] reductase